MHLFSILQFFSGPTKASGSESIIVDWYGCTWVIEWVRVNFCQLLLVTVVAAAMVAIVVVVGNIIIDYGCIESNLRQGSRKS